MFARLSAEEGGADDCHAIEKAVSERIEKIEARGLVILLGERLKKFWKMSVHWLKCVRIFFFSL